MPGRVVAVDASGTSSIGVPGAAGSRQCELKPDIVVTDISMPNLNGVDACKKLLKLAPETKIIFLTVHNDADMVAEVIRAGAKGYLSKNTSIRKKHSRIIKVNMENGSGPKGICYLRSLRTIRNNQI